MTYWQRGDFLIGELKLKIASARHSLLQSAVRRNGSLWIFYTMCHTVQYVSFMCSLSTRCITTVIGSSGVSVLQYLCEHAQMHERNTHTHKTMNRQSIFCFGIRVKVLSLFNQLYPKTEIRLPPVTYFSVGPVYKLWESVKPTEGTFPWWCQLFVEKWNSIRHIVPLRVTVLFFVFCCFVCFLVKLLPFRKH